jgi:hypothetical protein
MIDFIVTILAIMGAIYVGTHILYPLLDAIIFSIGYTFFFLWQLSIKKILKHPLSFIKFFIQTALKGFVTRLDWGEVQHIKQGKHIWKPYFHYEGFD